MTGTRVAGPWDPSRPADARRVLGAAGEELACRWYRAAGYEVLDRNWRCSLGELDVVAQRGATLVFSEVKARRSHRYGLPGEAVGPEKQARLRRLASRWLATRAPAVRARTLRFDVVAVTWPPGEPPRLVVYEGADTRR